MRFLLKLVPWAFHPLLVTTLITGIALLSMPELFPNISIKLIPYFLAAVFLTTGLIPAFCLWTMKNFSLIRDFDLTDRKERLLPFFTIIFLYVLTFFFFESNGISSPFTTMLLIVTILIGLLLVITQWFKVSIHSAATWGGTGMLSAIDIAWEVELGDVIYASILAAGLTCTSRLYFGYHKPNEIWIGTFLGFGFCFVAVFFLS